MTTINAIVEELEKIPEPMQVCVLEFVRTLATKPNLTENNNPTNPSPRILGLNRGAMKMSDDFDEPLPIEFWLGEE